MFLHVIFLLHICQNFGSIIEMSAAASQIPAYNYVHYQFSFSKRILCTLPCKGVTIRPPYLHACINIRYPIDVNTKNKLD